MTRRNPIPSRVRGHILVAAIGKPMQIAFVPEDFDAALRHWTENMGVGPFFVMERIRLEDARFMGEPSDCTFTIALAQWGDVQIELIRQDNDALMAAATLRAGFRTDVEPILQMARARAGAAIDPVAAYRASGYRAQVAARRPKSAAGGGGIV